MQRANTDIRINECNEIQTGNGPAKQLEQILASGLPSLYRRAYRILGNTADAEDAVQDALLAAYAHLDQFKRRSQLSTWLTAIVLNCARMQLRRRRHVHVPLEEFTGEPKTVSAAERLADHRPDPEHEFMESELTAHLTHSYRQLSPTVRRTFQLRDVDGLSVRETAKILGIPSGTVKARSARARKKLSEVMRRALKPRSRSLSSRVPGFGAGTRIELEKATTRIQ